RHPLRAPDGTGRRRAGARRDTRPGGVLRVAAARFLSLRAGAQNGIDIVAPCCCGAWSTDAVAYGRPAKLAARATKAMAMMGEMRRIFFMAFSRLRPRGCFFGMQCLAGGEGRP